MEQRKKCLMQIFLVIFLFSTVNKLLSQPQQPFSCKHFVLVHGACHGAWCWYKLVTLLKSSGHTVTALDLGASGIDSKQLEEVPSISDYFQPLIDFMSALPSGEKVILVGHSFGGLAISQAMERFPEKIYVAVFVTAAMPGPSLNASTIDEESSRRQGPLLDCRFTYDEGPDNPPTSFSFGPLYLASNLYEHSPAEDLILATLSIRPVRLYSEKDNMLMLSKEKYESVNRVYIISDEDKAMKKDFQQWMIEKNPPDGIEVIIGSDHMVMISKPKELWVHLGSIGEKYY